MKKWLWLALLPMTMMVSCKKDKEPCAEVVANVPSSEVTTLRGYIQSASIDATEDPRGFFYKIENAGTGTKPASCSTVNVNYAGRLTNGASFDGANNVTFNLAGLIKGWQLGLPLIGAGGRIILYLPPSLGYGNQSAGSIPPNSILVFTIDLLAVS